MGPFRLKGKSRRTVDIILSTKSVFSKFRFGEGLQSDSPGLPSGAPLQVILQYSYGHAVAQLAEALRYKPKVAGSIPKVVTVIFHWHNPVGRTVAPRVDSASNK